MQQCVQLEEILKGNSQLESLTFSIAQPIQGKFPASFHYLTSYNLKSIKVRSTKTRLNAIYSNVRRNRGQIETLTLLTTITEEQHDFNTADENWPESVPWIPEKTDPKKALKSAEASKFVSRYPKRNL